MTARLNPDDLYHALKEVIDPEIQHNIVDIGLVYAVDVTSENDVVVSMTLTTPHCPMGPEIIDDVKKTLQNQGARSVQVDIVWEPMWTPELMSPELKAMLGIEEEPRLAIPSPSPPSELPRKKKRSLLGRLFGGS
jgi:metal-sulfur cluster biosynthetic enzyme